MSRPDALAPALLLVMTARHYAWQWAPAGHAGEASKALGALAAMALLGMLWRAQAPAGRVMGAVLALYAWHELQAALCASWFMVAPWPLAADEPMCSARVGFDLGALGIMGAAWAAWRITQNKTDKVSG